MCTLTPTRALTLAKMSPTLTLPVVLALTLTLTLTLAPRLGCPTLTLTLTLPVVLQGGGRGVASFLQRLRTELVPSWWLGDSQRQGQGQG